MDALTPTEYFILGALAAIALGCLWLGVPALWWAIHDRVEEQPGVDELLDLDRCDDCLDPLTDDNAAVTCSAHRYCVGCDDYANRCTACAYARGLALIEERA